MSEAEQRHFELEEAQFIQEKWFLATEGLRTVRALMIHFGTQIENSNLFTDLRGFERALNDADKRGIRWHLGIDD